MNQSIEFLILDTISKRGSLVPLFKTGYSYSQVMKWCNALENSGKIIWSEEGTRVLTQNGEQCWKQLRNSYAHAVLPIIQPYSQYKTSAKISVDDIYLP